jgi:hypothetical protein
LRTTTTLTISAASLAASDPTTMMRTRTVAGRSTKITATAYGTALKMRTTMRSPIPMLRS